MAEISLFSKTIVGRRSNNQDACFAKLIRPGVYFLAVADGMGGAAGGQIASSLVIEVAEKILREEFSYEVRPEELKGILERVFLSAQKSIAARIKSDSSLTGMGTTLTCVLIDHDNFVWGNLGDSRVYLLRDDKLSQVTHDHTLVQNYVDSTNEKVSDNILSQYSHYLLKSLDGGSDEPDIFPQGKDFESTRNGDMFMLCSDGLITDKSEKDTAVLKQLLQSPRSLNEAAEKLISAAYQNGSKDNITVVIAQVGKRKPVRKSSEKRQPGFSGKPRVTAKLRREGLAILSVLVAGVAVLLYLRPNVILKSPSKTHGSTGISKEKTTQFRDSSVHESSINEPKASPASPVMEPSGDKSRSNFERRNDALKQLEEPTIKGGKNGAGLQTKDVPQKSSKGSDSILAKPKQIKKN